MDLATIIGIVAAFGVTAWAIYLGGSFGAFVDIPSIAIVVGGGIGVVVVRFPLSGLMSAMAIGSKAAFSQSKVSPRELIEKITEMAEVVRKQGPLGLESFEVDDPFLAKGKQMVADGYDPAFIQDTLERERDLYLERLVEGARIYKAMGDSAPAFGMIGTLVGLVQMLQSMDDPSTIGPAMAVALLTTLYGALIANVVCLPIFEKLNAKVKVEEINQTLVIDGIVQIRNSKSPNLIREMLISYLPDKQRALMDEAA
ncbi:motility protein A [Methylobrevis pamukkalensis]|nr:MotA/TolQ/ExbB proton channel family protein [Methylobrevis pamukkalensis]